ncbi:hypothetical protein GCM10023310_13740 [Paenibacillus vulneris]|uniref:Uncharacterized protein n=1 Tax=Paenibacillus vulneris TaxID=1133364 RepID=A0ABW3UJA0_9BACL
MNIQTPIDLSAHVDRMLQERGSRSDASLESYLRSLYVNVLSYKNEVMTYSLVGKLLEQSFDTAPIQYMEEWNQCSRPPVLETAIDGFTYTREVLQFHIFDLREMERQEEENRYRFLGTTSRTNHTWYNFDVHSYLECAASGLEDHLGDDPHCDWFTLGVFLELGRLYE